MKSEQTSGAEPAIAEFDTTNQPWNLIFSTSWTTFTSLFFCLSFISFGISRLALFWGGSDGSSDKSVFVLSIGFFALLAVAFWMLAMFCWLLRLTGIGTKLRPPKYWKYANMLLGFCFLFAILAPVFGMTFKIAMLANAEVARDQAEAAAKQEWIEHRFFGELISLNTPSNWKILDGVVSGQYQLVDEANGLVLSVGSDPKIDTTVKSLAELQDTTLDNLKTVGFIIDDIHKSEVSMQSNSSN